MLDPLLRLRHLRCFVETARRGSLNAAAEALNVSQPAASKTIRELEDILGVHLFDRSGRRLVLTEAGLVFQRHAGTALADLERAQTLVRENTAKRRKLSVGVLPTASTQLFPAAAEAFRARFPDCTLRISTGPNWLLLSQLREGELDLVVGRMPPQGLAQGLDFHRLYWERVVPIVRPGHPLAGTEWAPSDLQRFPLMLPPGGAVIAPAVRSYLQSLGIGEAIASYDNVSQAFGIRTVQISDTIWFISEGVVRTELDRGELAVLPVRDELLGGPVGLSRRRNSRRDEAADALCKEIAEVAARLHGESG
ncbi:LysR substrate-binding domain-containing protein [Fulvimarina sp. MAC8]|uniref:LysR substrate-binding domain-containing protein n=1 Tax=Fulvimarina sp. MAC8 TaxID=3162874 RepID=UPI0032EB4FB2